jgi:hypothetical protein
MRVVTILYRNKNDFVFGSFHIRTGSAWEEISGRLKSTNKETLHMRIEFRPGSGKEYIVMSQKEE